jgi:hypothetical protein
MNPERWGSPLVQQKYQKEMACDKRQDDEDDDDDDDDNNNNEKNKLNLVLSHGQLQNQHQIQGDDK